MLLAQYFHFKIFPLALNDDLLYVACTTGCTCGGTNFRLTYATLPPLAPHSTADQHTAVLYIDNGPYIHRYAATFFAANHSYQHRQTELARAKHTTPSVSNQSIFGDGR